MTDLPSGWAMTRLSEICAINPRVDKSAFEPDTVVSFVAMPAVEAETGKIDVSETRTFAQVKQGYTPFRKGDVLFAKITPCMENGKMAIVPEMVSDHGFGSTEFHVLRPAQGVDPKYIYHAVSNQGFRYHAEHNMTGAVGQKRVPASVLEDHELGLPPSNEQRRIVEKIEAMFDEIDKGVESLQTARATLGLYRQSLLKSAFEGRLTADWRAKNADKLEDPETLLARIHHERDTHYKAALNAWQDALAEWRVYGEKGKKPAKPKRQADFEFHREGNTSPWPTVRVEAILRAPLINGRSVKDKAGGFPVLRLTALKNGKIILSEHKDGNWTEDDARPFLVEHEDIFLARGNGSKKLVGIGGRVMEKPMPVAFPDTMIRVRLDTSAVRPDFFLLAWNSWTVRSQIEEAARTTAGIYKINQDHVSGFTLPLPSLIEQAEIVRILEEKLEAADALEAEIDAALTRANALRQSILKKAFSGQLVPQDPNDEPASALLERIKAERAKATTAKRRRVSA